MQIWPSGSWVSPSYADIMNDRYFAPVNITLDPNADMFKIRSAISGHGQQGEFIARTHTIKLNSSINFSRSVWRECATNPIYPQGGTWIYDRAGWCPGMAVDLKEFEITPNVTSGQTINLDYSLPVISSSGQSNYRVN
ncbi:MAG TPA: peptide-N-glycosidase F-related protein, partial [Bacteroidia bacterium]|nr:peptide-N-glycosidase F-related protein [Bacteroidia bacterium]